MKKKKNNNFTIAVVAIVAIFLLGFLYVSFNIDSMPTGKVISEDTLEIPGTLMQSTGTTFSITDSEYLNVDVTSTEVITLSLWSIPEMIDMYVSSDVSSTTLTISNMQALTTYYMYTNDYHDMQSFTTNVYGSYTWTQPLSSEFNHIGIQPRPSTYFINDAGGDCTSIGTWDSITKTCTLNTDITGQGIVIDSSYTTLDCNGHGIIGTGTGKGIYFHSEDGVTIKNCHITGFSHGIYFIGGDFHNITFNTIDNNYYGISFTDFLGRFQLHNNNINYNNIYNNTNFEVYVFLMGSADIGTDLTNNWWGFITPDCTKIIGIENCPGDLTPWLEELWRLGPQCDSVTGNSYVDEACCSVDNCYEDEFMLYNHGMYVSCVADATKTCGLEGKARGETISTAAKSNVNMPGYCANSW